MNDKEQMQALLDGKILMCDGDRYKLDEDGDLTQQCVESGETYWYKLGGCEFSFYSGNVEASGTGKTNGGRGRA